MQNKKSFVDEHDRIHKGEIDPDLGFEIGDLITTYNKGYWKLIHLKRRFHDNHPIASLAHYEKVSDAEGNPPKSRIVKQCDISWCRKFTKEALAKMQIEEHDQISRKYKLLRQYAKWENPEDYD